MTTDTAALHRPVREYYIAIDFDGTIVDHQYPMIGKPVPDAIAWMKHMMESGYKLILFTMRHGPTLDEAVDYLTDNGIELFGINDNPTQSNWTGSRKVYAHKYIDDAAVGCPLIQPEGFERECVNWNVVGRIVMGYPMMNEPVIGDKE